MVLKIVGLVILALILLVGTLASLEISARRRASSTVADTDARIRAAVVAHENASDIVDFFESKGWRRLPFDSQSPTDDPNNLKIRMAVRAPLGNYTITAVVVPDAAGKVKSYQVVKHKAQL